MSVEHGPSAGEYIGHHLTHLQNKPMGGIVDFTVFNMDSLFWAISLGDRLLGYVDGGATGYFWRSWAFAGGSRVVG
jgi:hypothetical protein